MGRAFFCINWNGNCLLFTFLAATSASLRAMRPHNSRVLPMFVVTQCMDNLTTLLRLLLAGHLFRHRAIGLRSIFVVRSQYVPYVEFLRFWSGSFVRYMNTHSLSGKLMLSVHCYVLLGLKQENWFGCITYVDAVRSHFEVTVLASSDDI